MGGGPKGGWAGLCWASRTLGEQTAQGREQDCSALLGGSPVRLFPIIQEIWGWLPAVPTLCRASGVSGPAESVLEEHKIIQCNCGQLLQFDTEFDFCLPNGTSFQANFLTIPSLRTFLRGMGQIWNTLSMPNSLLCAMQRLHWCSAFRF